VKSLEETHPRPGLSVPVLSVLDEHGALIDEDQRALVRFVIQDGYGADVIFAAGTTGEWDRVGNALRQRVVQVCAEEVAKTNARAASNAGRGVEAWAGVTSRNARETLENLDFAIAHGADAAVLAPLSIQGIEDPVRFVARDVADLLDARDRRIPVYLYDNADIAIDPKVPHIRTRQVKALSRLDFVRGIKVSAPRRVLGNYTKAAAGFRERGDFGIYVGNALLIFELFAPRSGLFGVIAEHWNRYRLRGGLPIGVVAGPANVLPREWARAWQVCRAGDAERMQQARRVLEAFSAATHAAGAKHAIACFKRALKTLGVIHSAAVARGTPELAPEAAARFDAAFAAVRAESQETIGEPWMTLAPGESESARSGSRL
jgi:dihydrodipicolinate synthase/N-acetylneuraminate lyase